MQRKKERGGVALPFLFFCILGGRGGFRVGFLSCLLDFTSVNALQSGNVPRGTFLQSGKSMSVRALQSGKSMSIRALQSGKSMSVRAFQSGKSMSVRAFQSGKSMSVRALQSGNVPRGTYLNGVSQITTNNRRTGTGRSGRVRGGGAQGGATPTPPAAQTTGKRGRTA